MQRFTTPVVCILALFAEAAHAALSYSESFDYGNSTVAINTLGGWSTTSTLNKSDHAGGLTDARVSGELGGSFWADRNTGSLIASNAAPELAMSTIPVGGAVWFSVLFDYASGNSNHYIQFTGASVSALGVQITSAGAVEVWGSNNGGAATWSGTGQTAASGSYLMLVRATKGGTNDANGPINSVIDFWFNPTDVSSESALGASTWSSGADSKFGRNTETLTTVSIQGSYGGRIDEIRLATDYASLNLVPEPSTALLGGIGILVLLCRRRNS